MVGGRNMTESCKKMLLASIYETYETFWADTFFACRKGCASCCTQSVTITTIEGNNILEYLEEYDVIREDDLAGRLAAATPSLPACTTNQFAGSFLDGKVPEAGAEEWSLAPCIFLAGNCCTIYPARPFACRCFASTAPCGPEGAALLPTAVISLNTAVMQIIEHLDQGGCWGNMIEVLKSLAGLKPTGGGAGPGHKKSKLYISQENPGFLIPPEDEAVVVKYLNTLYMKETAGRTFAEWLH
ncbi:MAG TPA: hypothetical protein ENG91_02965 [Desulfobacteraceae bacterium]|nr:hypothetical protein [Desulfobacteraceae bacterium]HDO31152.1 hypothetical protein [Desulfobacteraceae bacterium]HDZ75999.1 hypothetical protein [Desulfobacteraceae bacterium]